MSRTYHHLSAEERAVIMLERQNGSSLRSIALRLGRSRTSSPARSHAPPISELPMRQRT
ncbi:helix-turn-helix domain-containing protein, partial [Thermomonas fusca]|uniref:helix-turn-helix domain-containing protein n=1 Tax=Thermomonas fusca TaxID=215690 RepID=UPI0012EBF162